jgi:hypothetical protein
MKVATIVILASALLRCNAVAYAQATSSATSSTSAQADKSGAQASGSHAASASAQTGQTSASLSSGTAMNATLSQPVDAKKNKPGDPVTARTTDATKSDGRVVIPRGTKLIGHVTEAKARAKGESESALGIVFDKAILKNGQEVPLNVTIQALAAAQTASSSLGGDDLATNGGAVASGRASGGGALGGVRSTAGSTVGAVTNTAANVGGVAGGAAGGAVNSTANAAGATKGAVGGLNTAGQLSSNSQGVFGLNGLNLNSAASNNAQGSLVTSTSKNVRLDSGTQLLLISQGQVSGAGPR